MQSFDKENIPPSSYVEVLKSEIQALKKKAQKLQHTHREYKRTHSAAKISEKCLCTKRRRTDCSRFVTLHKSCKSEMITDIENYVTLQTEAEEQKAESMDALIMELFQRGSEERYERRIDALFQNERFASAFKKRMQRQEKDLANDPETQLDSYVARKVSGLGVKKRNKLVQSSAPKVMLSDKITYHSAMYKESWYKDQKARTYAKSKVPYFPKVWSFPKSQFPQEHGYVRLKELLKTVIFVIFTSPDLRKQMHWFWDPEAKHFKVFHFQLAIFYDGFPLFKRNQRGACVACIQILNLIGLLQKPEFSFLQSFICDSEQGTQIY